MTTGTLITIALDTNANAWNGYTIVERFAPAGLTLPPGIIANIRVTFEAGTTEGLTITNAYIGHRAASGDAYDFSATPTQLLFAGSANKAISSSSQAVSDWAAFPYNKTSDLLVAFYVGGGASVDTVRYKTGVTNTNSYYKVANEAATVNKASYTDNGTTMLSIAKIEVEYVVIGVSVTMISEFGMI